MAGSKRQFGSIRAVNGGRFQARYRGPDGVTRNGPMTFGGKADADTWLATVQADIVRGTWLAPEAAEVTLKDYADGWLASRDLKPTTRHHYRRLLDVYILPALGGMPVGAITPTGVREWHTRLGVATGPTMRAHAYGLLRTIMNTAVSEDVRSSNPCRVRGGGNTERVVVIKPATLPELAVIVDEIPARYKTMILLAAWCALRFGELAELRRSDVDLADDGSSGVLHIRRGMTRVGADRIVGTPKTRAGIRDVHIPPPLVPVVAAHLANHCAPGADGLLFPSASDPAKHIEPSTLYRVWYRARGLAGRDDLRFHDLRHTGAVLAASTGASLAELMARLGHRTHGAALRYQHATDGSDAAVADRLGALMSGPVTTDADVIPLRPRQR